MRIAVVGSGYVGLVSAACLADSGHEVVCVDRDPSRLAAVRDGRAPFYEPGLNEILARQVGHRLEATGDLAAAVRSSDASLVCVGTPFDGERIDLSAVEGAVREIGAALRGSRRWHTVVVRSTVVPGTTDGLVRRVLESEAGRPIGDALGLATNPEFLTEGSAVADFAQPDRIVIGTRDDRSRAALDEMYSTFSDVPRLYVTPREAELIKYASNALLATAISFANEIADLCEVVGEADVTRVMKGVHLSRYLTAQVPNDRGWTAPLASFLEAGCGYGGSCLPKDVRALVAEGRTWGLPMTLLRAVDEINRRRPERVLALLGKHFGTLEGVPVTVLGLAFKPDTDDVRQTPAAPLIDLLLDRKARVTVYDPVALHRLGSLYPRGDVIAASSMEEAVREAAAVVLVTRWQEFASLPDVLDRLGVQPLVVDGRRMLDSSAFARYEGIGRG